MVTTDNAAGMARGFAIPAILIASVVMMMVLAAAVSAVVASRNALVDQRYNQMAREAAESGLAMARACIDAGTTTWAEPLRPSGGCTGLATQCTSNACYVVEGAKLRTRFAVETPTTTGGSPLVRSIGTTELVRSDGSVWKAYQQDVKWLGETSVAMPATSEWKQLPSLGYTHSCGIASDDWVYCWGANTVGQLGVGATTPSNSATPLPFERGAIPVGVTAKSVSVGYEHACMIGSDDWMYCWGGGTEGQLGNNTTSNSVTPVAVQRGSIPVGVTISQIATGYLHTCALGSNNRVYCWGRNTLGEVGNNTTTSNFLVPQQVAYTGGLTTSMTVTQISGSTAAHTCALTSVGNAYCWGNNQYGQLGIGNTTLQRRPTTTQKGSMGTRLFGTLSTSYEHTCTVTPSPNSRMYCWGRNNSGDLGNNSTTNSSLPVTFQAGSIGAMPNTTVNSVHVSLDRTCVRHSNNQLYCWGGNYLGDGGGASGSMVPVELWMNPPRTASDLPYGSLINEVSIGLASTCVRASDDHIYCWGFDYALSDGGPTTNAPRRMPGPTAGGGASVPSGEGGMYF